MHDFIIIFFVFNVCTSALMCWWQSTDYVAPVKRLFENVLRDVIHKGLPIHYSLVLVQISPPSLFVMCQIANNSCSKVSLGRLICTTTEEKRNSCHLWLRSIAPLNGSKKVAVSPFAQGRVFLLTISSRSQ